MGDQHGRLVLSAGGPGDLFEFYDQMLVNILCATGTPGALRGLVSVLRPAGDALMRRLSRNRPDEYRARTAAFLAALDLPASAARYGFVMDAFQNIVGLAARHRLGPMARFPATCAPIGCSTLAVWDEASSDGRMLHGRNFDFPGVGIWDRSPTVVLCDPEEGVRYGFVTTRGADIPGITSFNEAGLCVTLHTRFHSDVSFSGAGVVDLAHAISHRAETLGDAVAIARERQAASTWGISVSSASERRAAVIETHGSAVDVTWSAAGEAFSVCTNRYQSPKLAIGQVSPSPSFNVNSDGREGWLRERGRRAPSSGGYTVADIQGFLGSHEDPDHPDEQRAGLNVVTCPAAVQSVVGDPERRSIHVSVGRAPTGHGPYVEVPWDWDGEVGVEALTPTSATPTVVANDPGYSHYVEATALDGTGGGLPAVRAALTRAVEASPSTPEYRFLLGAVLLRVGEEAAAVEQFRAGLAHEHHAFMRGQLLLWGARAASAASRPDLARAWQLELLELEHPQLIDHQRQAREELTRPIKRRTLRRLSVGLILVDAAI